MGDKKFSSEFKPRYSDFDVQGILNSKNYIDLLAEARVDQMTRCYGVSMNYYQELGLTWVLSKIALEFQKPLFVGDSLVIQTEVTAIITSYAEVAFEAIRKSDKKLCAIGKAVYCLVELKTKKPVNISSQDSDIFLSR